MIVGHDIAYFFGGALLTNAVPHFVSGVMGRPFQTPFANPPGKGLSSSTINVAWGFLNVLAGLMIFLHVGSFDIHSIEQSGAAGLGVLVFGLITARMFGRFHGGNAPTAS